jgi:hypothetical protein
MTPDQFLVFDIGCIECREPSSVVGVYATREEASRVRDEYDDEEHPEWGGDHSVEVFVISGVDREQAP